MFRSARKAARRDVSNGGQNSVYDYNHIYKIMGKADEDLVSGVDVDVDRRRGGRTWSDSYNGVWAIFIAKQIVCVQGLLGNCKLWH
jgi:hypothetical protein